VVEMDMGFEQRSTPHLPVAVLLEGAFASAYRDRLPANFTQDPNVGYREQGKRTAQLVISDGDVIINRVDSQKGMYYMLGYDRYANAKIYGNRELLMNAMNYLLDDRSLISIRSRSIVLRQLDPERILTERTRWQLVNIVVPVLLSIAFGILFNLARRRRAAAPKAS